MFYHVDQNFPEAMTDIEALAGKDPGFAMLLADFEELSTWLASGECGTSRNELEIENAEELVRELKVEIRRKLEEHDERNS